MDHFSAILPAICAGLGIFLVGVANFIFLGRSLVLRAGATTAALGIALVIAAQFEPSSTLVRTAQLLALVLIPVVVFASSRLGRPLGVVISTIRRPIVCAALLVVGGIGLAIGSVIEFERVDQQVQDDQQAELDFFHSYPPSRPAVRDKAVTDRGTRIPIHESTEPRDRKTISELEARSFAKSPWREMFIRVGPADDRSNCHGWVFTGGRYILSGKDVEVILKENDYRGESRPRTGDLVIYRSGFGGNITHTGVVQYITDGEPVLVRGKWGPLGVFTHPVDQSPYGTEFSYYRSPRSGHMISISPLSTGEIATTPATE